MVGHAGYTLEWDPPVCVCLDADLGIPFLLPVTLITLPHIPVDIKMNSHTALHNEFTLN